MHDIKNKTVHRPLTADGFGSDSCSDAYPRPMHDFATVFLTGHFEVYRIYAKNRNAHRVIVDGRFKGSCIFSNFGCE